MNARHTPPAGLPLHAQGLSKDFGARSILHNIHLEIPPGQFVALIGRSGCGKSTLLRLLAGLDAPTSGQIDTGTGNLNTARSATRIMFQEARLLPWKRVIENVALGLDNAWDRARAALEAVGLAERAQDWPATLSGGQKQRVALARALIHQPRLLLLDEPLGALDALTRIEMQRLIESLWQRHGFTVVLVTHDVHEAVNLADRILLIEHGHIALDLDTQLPRPRQDHGQALGELQAHILQRLLNTPAHL